MLVRTRARRSPLRFLSLLRSPSLLRSAFGVAGGLLLAAACLPAGHPVHGAGPNTPAANTPAANTPQFYTARIQPVFQANCYRCHGGLNHRGGLVMDSKVGLERGGGKGPVLVPGHPEQSLLVTLIRHEGPKDDPMNMPPKGKLSDADIAAVEQWIRAGAAMPPDSPR